MAPLIAILRDLRPFDSKKPSSEAEPIVVVKRMMYDLLVGAGDPATQKRFATLVGAESREDAQKALTLIAKGFKRALAGSGIEARALADIVVNMPYKLEGNEQLGYRVSVSRFDDDENKTWMTFERVSGQLKLVASNATLHSLGEAALRKLTAGQLPAARQLLLWAKEERRVGLSWLTENADKRQLALAATLLTIEAKPAALSMLTKLCAKPASDAEGLACAGSLAIANAAEHHPKEAVVYAKAFLEKTPDAEWMRDLMITNQALTGELDASTSTKAAIAVAFALESRGNLVEAERAMIALHKAGKATEHIYNNLAWMQLFLREPTEDTLNFARRAAEGKHTSSAYWHTLATIQASRGALLDARNSLFKSMNLRLSDGPNEDDHYVLGRIADGLGLMETAYTHYAKASKTPSDSLTDTSKLAERRLAQLQKTNKAPSAQVNAGKFHQNAKP
jgi:tetratricopeptide (TPR) repeat protein